MNSDSVAARFKHWLSKPYDDSMSVGGWFAFAGLLIVISWLWSRVLGTLSEIA